MEISTQNRVNVEVLSTQTLEMKTVTVITGYIKNVTNAANGHEQIIACR